MAETEPRTSADSLDGILSRIGAEAAHAAPAAGAVPAGQDDKSSLKQFRESLLSLGWSKEDVYAISPKFFGLRSASELNAQFSKLLNSFHYHVSPSENRDLALKVLSDEMTSADAVKKSFARKSAAELRETLSGLAWAVGYADRLVEKYAGEKTAAELETKYKLIVSELAQGDATEESRRLALEVLLDWSNYGKIYHETLKGKFARDVAELFPTLDEDYRIKVMNAFFGKEEARALSAKCDDFLASMKADNDGRNRFLALRALLGELTKEAAEIEIKSVRNKAAIEKAGKSLDLSAETVGRITANCSGTGGKWFEDEFLRVFSALSVYAGSDRRNSLLAARVLAGEMTEARADAAAAGEKNREDILSSAAQVPFAKELSAALLERYCGGDSVASFSADFSAALRGFPDDEAAQKASGTLAARVLLGEITRDDALRMAGLAAVFGRYELAQEDLDKISARYLAEKTPSEMLARFEAILAKLPFVSSREEVFALALKAFLDGSPEAEEAAVKQAAARKEKSGFQKALNSYGWFSGYASELGEKYFSVKPAQELIADFEKILAELDHAREATENYDLGIKVLLGRMTPEEARRGAQFRKELGTVAWGRDFAQEIAENYLGTKTAQEAVKFIDVRLEAHEFWKNDPARLRFCIEKFIRELNGQSNEKVSLLVLELFKSGVPLQQVKDIAVLAETVKNPAFDPAEVAKKYSESFQAEQDHRKAAAKIQPLIV